MKLYIMRHGLTNWNEKKIIQGRSNNRLSKTGVALTEEAAKNFKNKKIDFIISSPLFRTIQTANIINKYHKVKVIKDNRLTEIDQGIFTGKSKEKLTSEEIKLKKSKSKLYGMESYEECYLRIFDFFNEIKQKFNDKRVLVVTHNVCASLLAGIVKNEKVNYANPYQLKNFNNSEIREFDI